MALETLKDTFQIDGYWVTHYRTDMDYAEPGIPHKGKFIDINHDENTITFKIQNKPVKEAGINGCQVDTLIAAAWVILEGLNKNFSSIHNEKAINCLASAYAELQCRKADRESRGVEGTSQA